MRFGFQVETHIGMDYSTLRQVAVESEKLGLHALWLCDHLIPRTEQGVPAAVSVLETWTALAALASETSVLRLGTLCTCSSFRHPALLAKMASMVDNISNGRLNFGIGAGWYEPEYNAYGVPYSPARIRIQQLEEAVQIIKGMWTSDAFTFTGRYYSARNAICEPKPSQKPRPKILIGGTGEKLLLRTVARHADAMNFIATTPEEFTRKIEIFDKHASGFGRSSSEITRTVYLPGLLARNQDELERKFELYYAKRRPTSEDAEAFKQRMLRSANRIIGTPDTWVERIKQFEHLGVTEMMFYMPDLGEITPIRVFEDEVMSSFET